MLPFVRLGPFLVQMPGLALLAGVWIGLSLAEKEGKRLKLNSSDIYNMGFYGLIAGLVGARLGYAARYINVYLANPLSLFALTSNTLSPDAGIVTGIVVATLFGWRKKLPVRPSLDALSPGLAALMVAVGVSHIFSGDAFGTHANLPWAVYLWDDYRHPSQFYETLVALAILAAGYRRILGEPGDGTSFLLFVALTAAARIFLEGFRGDSIIWIGGFRAAQIIGLIVLAGSLWLIKAWTNRLQPDNGERPGRPGVIG